MRKGWLLVLAAAALGCATKSQIVYGESFVSTAEAVQEVQRAVRNAEGVGCRAVSVGGAGAGAAVETGGGLLINAYALLRCPSSAPELAPATGLPR